MRAGTSGVTRCTSGDVTCRPAARGLKFLFAVLVRDIALLEPELTGREDEESSP